MLYLWSYIYKYMYIKIWIYIHLHTYMQMYAETRHSGLASVFSVHCNVKMWTRSGIIAGTRMHLARMTPCKHVLPCNYSHRNLLIRASKLCVYACAPCETLLHEHETSTYMNVCLKYAHRWAACTDVYVSFFAQPTTSLIFVSSFYPTSYSQLA